MCACIVLCCTAVRGKEKRVQVKLEQEEKSKKRVEAKVLKNQLAIRQAEALRWGGHVVLCFFILFECRHQTY